MLMSGRDFNYFIIYKEHGRYIYFYLSKVGTVGIYQCCTLLVVSHIYKKKVCKSFVENNLTN